MTTYFFGEFMSNKIMNHPDKDEIIKRMLEGESVRSIESWLKEKYPNKKRNHISYPTLQIFRQENLNIRGEVLEDIKEIKAAKDEAEKEKILEEKVKKSNAYKEKLEEIVSQEIDVNRRLLEMEALVNSRIEFYFNILNSGGTIREDKIFIEYINILRGLMSDWKKFIEGYTDNKVEHNVNINVMMQQITIIKNVVSDVLQDIQPELVPSFIDKLNEKLDLVDYENESKKEIHTREIERS